MRAMCHCLFQHSTNIEAHLRAAEKISVFLDYDGTLVPFVQNPAEAQLDEQTRKTLVRISSNRRVSVTIISGRSLADIRARVGLEGLTYAGNHGLEICGDGMQFIEPTAAARKEELAQLSRRLAGDLGDIEGAVVEYKGLTTTIHFRTAAVREIGKIENAVGAAVAVVAESFRTASSKMAIEVVPRTRWHKGRAAAWINQHLGGKPLSLFMGDDETDEDAFRALPDGINVKVGSCTDTAARYCVADPSAVHEFLTWFANHVPA
jgi:trehalose 6-phosphate phosphatase